MCLGQTSVRLTCGNAGCDVVLTDMEEVLPLLRNNYVRNVSPSALRGVFPDSPLFARAWLVSRVDPGAVFPLLV